MNPFLRGAPNHWGGVQRLEIRNFLCGWCEKNVASDFGLSFGSDPRSEIRICPNCLCPVFFSPVGDAGRPRPKLGARVAGLPTEVEALFEEVRLAASAGANTAAVTVARTLLLRMAWERGAPKSISAFKPAVEWLVENGHVAKSAKEFLDHVKDVGNKSVHEEFVANAHDSELVVLLLVNVLRALYENAHLIKLAASR